MRQIFRDRDETVRLSDFLSHICFTYANNEFFEKVSRIIPNLLVCEL